MDCYQILVSYPQLYIWGKITNYLPEAVSWPALYVQSACTFMSTGVLELNERQEALLLDETLGTEYTLVKEAGCSTAVDSERT